jgi:hypothetical protein
MFRRLLPVLLIIFGCDDATPVSTSLEGMEATYDAGPFTVPSGEEIVICTYLRGENATEQDVTLFRTEQSAGGHHLIVYTVDHPIDLPPGPCPQGGQPGWSQILVTQIEHEEIAFPDGVGFRVAPNQQYVLETHYLNTTPATLEASSRFTTRYGEPGTVVERAATYFFGTMNIDVGARATASASVDCAPPLEMNLRTMFGHEHRWGVGVDVALVRGESVEPIYASTDWERPPIEEFEGGLTVQPSDMIRVACDWHNLGNDGARFPHEMCFAVGYYWPADTGVICVSGGLTDGCTCQHQGAMTSGPGGSHVTLHIRRQEAVSGVRGAMDAGAPVYCALYDYRDWGSLFPNEGAQPRYFRSAVDQPLVTGEDAIAVTFDDVSPGDYKVSCMMDTIGGGWILGTGDPVAVPAVDVHVDADSEVSADVLLNFAMP